MRRLMPLLLMFIGMLAAVPIAAQTDTTAALPHVAPLVGLTTLLFTAGGSAVYQGLKKVVAPLDKLPAPIHIALVMGGNILYQNFAPALSHSLGFGLPGDLSHVGPAAVTGALSGLAMMGLHGLGKKVQGWLGSTAPATA